MKLIGGLLGLAVLVGMLAYWVTRPCQRFVPIKDSPAIALDTKTGRACLTVPKTENARPTNRLPYCEDLH